VLTSQDLGRVFNWLRPNDLVWNYWVNNYLLGKDPPAFDILAWNNDGTRLPAALHADFLDLFEHNCLQTPGALTVLGTPIDLSTIQCDAFVTGALTDHLTPWKACYQTTQMLGGRSEFILSSSGHIQSLVNPPGNPKARYFSGPEPGPDPDTWLAEATQHTGTWWDLWADWMRARGGDDKPAPQKLGNRRFPALDPAPGTYIYQN
jgi:polyhydroxyalkanoate synthase